MTTTVTCPHCGAATTVGMTLEGVSFGGNSVNMSVECSVCGRRFDAASRSGTYSTIAGRLELIGAAREIAHQIAAARPDARDLHDLREALAEGRRAQASPEQVAERIGRRFAGLEDWVKANPLKFALLSYVASSLLNLWIPPAQEPAPPVPHTVEVNIHVPSDDVLREVVEEAIDQFEQEHRRGASDPG